MSILILFIIKLWNKNCLKDHLSEFVSTYFHPYGWYLKVNLLILDAFGSFNLFINNYATDRNSSWHKVTTDVFLTHSFSCYMILTRVSMLSLTSVCSTSLKTSPLTSHTLVHSPKLVIQVIYYKFKFWSQRWLYRNLHCDQNTETWVEGETLSQ